MNINKSCSTCKLNFEGICASHAGEHSYGESIDDMDTQRSCWDANINYLHELAHSLPEADRLKFEYGDKTKEHLYDRIEFGTWLKQ